MLYFLPFSEPHLRKQDRLWNMSCEPSHPKAREDCDVGQLFTPRLVQRKLGRMSLVWLWPWWHKKRRKPLKPSLFTHWALERINLPAIIMTFREQGGQMFWQVRHRWFSGLTVEPRNMYGFFEGPQDPTLYEKKLMKYIFFNLLLSINIISTLSLLNVEWIATLPSETDETFKLRLEKGFKTVVVMIKKGCIK